MATVVDTRQPVTPRAASRKPSGPIPWLRTHIVQIVAGLALLYMFLPIVVVVAVLVQQAGRAVQLRLARLLDRRRGPPSAASRHCAASLALSFKIGVVATIAATILGTLVAFALGRYRFRGRPATNLLIFMPMATPEVVMGSSLLTLFVNLTVIPLGLQDDPRSRTSCSAVSFVVVTVKARIAGLDRAARAGRRGPLRQRAARRSGKVTFPLVAARHRRGRAARVLAVVRRLHHHELQRGLGVDVPDVRLRRRPARRPAAGQRRRLGDVLHRAPAGRRRSASSGAAPAG